MTSSYQGGGAEAVVKNLWEYSRYKSDVHWAVLSANKKINAKLDERLHIFHSRRTLFSFFKILKLLKEHKFNYVVSNLMYVNILMSFACLLSKTKFICVEHNVIYVPFLKRFTKSLLQRTLAKFTYRFAEKIVAVSSGVKNDLVKYLNLSISSIEVIHNPIKVSNIKNNSNIKSGIGYIGSHNVQKNVKFLIKSYCHYHKKQDKPEKLFIAGNIQEKDLNIYKKIIHNLNPSSIKDIEFMGYVESKDFYISRKVIVVPSYWEGFCNVVAESILYGTPIIATDCHSGPSDIIKLFGVGTLIEINSSSQLVESIIKALENKQEIYQGDNLLSPHRVWSKYYQLFKI